MHLAAGSDAGTGELFLGDRANSPQLAYQQRMHELRNLFRLYLVLTVGLVNFAGDFCDQFVWTNPGGRGQFGFLENRIANLPCQRSWRTHIRSDIKVSFVKGECFYQRREAMHDFTNYSCFLTIDIKTCR